MKTVENLMIFAVLLIVAIIGGVLVNAGAPVWAIVVVVALLGGAIVAAKLGVND